MEKLAIGCDEAAYELKLAIIAHLSGRADVSLVDLGAGAGEAVLYPEIALRVAQSVKGGQCSRGILLCGTGIGMCMSANKVPGIRAAVCHDVFSAERAMKSNDSHILCMGSRVIGVELAKKLADIWLDSRFSGGGSTAKVERMMEIERTFRG